MTKEKNTSSQLLDELVGNSTKFTQLLTKEITQLQKQFPDDGLHKQFEKIGSQTISVCPMALCDSLLSDLGITCPHHLLTGLGLTMFHISTHDDVVDETPSKRSHIADLVYAGNIAYGYGINLLMKEGFIDEACELVQAINYNHLYQTRIVSKLWVKPVSETMYLDAIITTRSWAHIGLHISLIVSKRSDLKHFARRFADCYGNICQLFDDIREIKQDLQNGYFSLPISYAKKYGLNLNKKADINIAITNSQRLANDCLKELKNLTDGHYPRLQELVMRIEKLGTFLVYSDDFKIK
jgi:geranylgeranyl pyrophosphate synthase